MKKIFLLFILMLLIPVTKVEGLYCTFNEIANLKKLAANVNYYYEYIEKDNNVSFNVTLVNLNKDFYFIDSTNNKEYTYQKNEIKISGYKSGQTIKYTFYPVNIFCQDEPLYTIRIVLPTYNKYYTDEICKGVENYSLCQKWSTHNLTYEQFVAKVKEYKEKTNNNEEEKEDATKSNLTNYIIDFLVNYYYIIILVVLSLVFMIYIIKKRENIYS